MTIKSCKQISGVPQFSYIVCTEAMSYFTNKTLLVVVISCNFFQAYLPKALNEFLEFIDYFSRNFLSNRDVNAGASKLFYGQGGFSSEVHYVLFFLPLLDVNLYHNSAIIVFD